MTRHRGRCRGRCSAPAPPGEATNPGRAKGRRAPALVAGRAERPWRPGTRPPPRERKRQQKQQQQSTTTTTRDAASAGSTAPRARSCCGLARRPGPPSLSSAFRSPRTMQSLPAPPPHRPGPHTCRDHPMRWRVIRPPRSPPARARPRGRSRQSRRRGAHRAAPSCRARRGSP